MDLALDLANVPALLHVHEPVIIKPLLEQRLRSLGEAPLVLCFDVLLLCLLPFQPPDIRTLNLFMNVILYLFGLEGVENGGLIFSCARSSILIVGHQRAAVATEWRFSLKS